MKKDPPFARNKCAKGRPPKSLDEVRVRHRREMCTDSQLRGTKISQRFVDPFILSRQKEVVQLIRYSVPLLVPPS